jgi:cobalamin biosynthesis protein CobD/CbiB
VLRLELRKRRRQSRRLAFLASAVAVSSVACLLGVALGRDPTYTGVVNVAVTFLGLVQLVVAGIILHSNVG